jgi:hypothetical protein
MTESDPKPANATTQSPKPAAPAAKKPAARWFDDEMAVPIRKLLFRESIDVPTEQGIRSLVSTERPGKPRYAIAWLPRAGVYLVRVTESRPAGMPVQHALTFTIPESWAIAEHETA